jgi:hypothetical protein
MCVYGIIDQFRGPRFAIVFLGSFFIIGLLLLLRVPKKAPYHRKTPLEKLTLDYFKLLKWHRTVHFRVFLLGSPL